jgi:hypothetical protein
MSLSLASQGLLDLPAVQPRADLHHAGGKLTFPMMLGVHGSAAFAGDRKEHRLALVRDGIIDGVMGGPFVLSIGMNPSTAQHDLDDLTVRKDQQFTRLLGCGRMVKMNAASYCSTDPAGLAGAGVPINHPMNHPMILEYAARAKHVLVSTGKPPAVMQRIAIELFRLLVGAGIPMICLGLTVDGWPKHTSRLAYSTPFRPFNPAIS